MGLRDIGGPVFLRRFHGWLTVAWGLAIPISLITSLKTSLIWIVLMSAWANFASHFAAWQSCRTEVKQDVELAHDNTSDDTPSSPIEANQSRP